MIIDDVGFLKVLNDKLIKDLATDKARVSATVISASVQVPQNFRCKPAGTGTSVMIMNDTKDKRRRVNLLGLFYKCGDVLNARASAQYFVDLNKITAAPSVQTTAVSGVNVEQINWKRDAKTEVELVAIHGGHGLPQPYYRRARLLGPSPMAPNGVEIT